MHVQITTGVTMAIYGVPVTVTGFRNHYGQAEVIVREKTTGKRRYLVLADVLRGIRKGDIVPPAPPPA